jgi:hypothetical protein
MGLFQRLLGTREPEFTERVWLTTRGKLADLIAQVRADQAAGIYPVTAAHFRGTLELLCDALEKNGLPYHLVESPAAFPTRLVADDCGRREILVLLSAAIPTSVVSSVPARPQGVNPPGVTVYLAEHYPLPPRDRLVLSLSGLWSLPMNFTCHTALDEPWLAPFRVERLLQLLERLGNDEKSVLSHPYLDRFIRKTQQTIAGQVRHEQVCRTCEEWMRVNMPRAR